MSEDEKIEEEEPSGFGDQFAKMILGGIAGFAAKWTVEHLYDSIIMKHRDQSAEIEQ